MNLTEQEISVIEKLRSLVWGSLTITKQNGKIVMIDTNVKEKVLEK